RRKYYDERPEIALSGQPIASCAAPQEHLLCAHTTLPDLQEDAPSLNCLVPASELHVKHLAGDVLPCHHPPDPLLDRPSTVVAHLHQQANPVPKRHRGIELARRRSKSWR